MRTIGLWLGLALIVLGGAAGLAELMGLLVRPAAGAVSIGAIWAGIDTGSLARFLAAMEGGLPTAVSTPVGAYLAWPAWLTFTLPGVALTLACRPRGGRTYERGL